MEAIRGKRERKKRKTVKRKKVVEGKSCVHDGGREIKKRKQKIQKQTNKQEERIKNREIQKNKQPN